MTKAGSFEEYIMSKDLKANVVVFGKEYIYTNRGRVKIFSYGL